MTVTPKQVAAKGYDDVRQTLNTLTRLPWSTAREVSATAAAGDPFIFAHGLGKPAVGYVTVYADQPVPALYEDLSSGFDRKTFLVLRPSAAIPTTRDINLSMLVW